MPSKLCVVTSSTSTFILNQSSSVLGFLAFSYLLDEWNIVSAIKRRKDNNNNNNNNDILYSVNIL
jgi:hypothetical protein